MRKAVFAIASRRIASPVYCGTDILPGLLGRQLRKRERGFAIIDEKVHRLYFGSLLRGILEGVRVYTFPSGERHKSMQSLIVILEWLYQAEADRESVLIAIGGGVVTDITGLAASCFMRGIRHLSVPTTLVAQIDASIGGKTAINLSATKNVAGTFYPPVMVISDSVFLRTLPRHQIKDGLVEAIKIFAACDSFLFKKHEASISRLIAVPELEPLIFDAVKLKVRIVSHDPFDRGLRRALNFGHTTGHAYEVLTGQPHGTSVAFGMLVALTLSREYTRLSLRDFDSVWGAVTTIYKRYHGTNLTAATMWEKILHDKKRTGDKINFVLLRRCGSHVLFPLTYDQFKRGLSKTVERMER